MKNTGSWGLSSKYLRNRITKLSTVRVGVFPVYPQPTSRISPRDRGFPRLAIKSFRSFTSCSVRLISPSRQVALNRSKSMTLPPKAYVPAVGFSAPLPFPCRPRKKPFHPQQEFVEIERLGQVVVPAQGKALDTLLRFAARRQDEDGQPVVLQPDIAQDRQAVDVGQHDIQDDEVRFPLLPQPQGGDAVQGDLRVIPLQREVEPQPLGDVPVVLDDEYPLLSRILHDDSLLAQSAPFGRGMLRMKTDPFPGPSLSASTSAP